MTPSSFFLSECQTTHFVKENNSAILLPKLQIFFKTKILKPNKKAEMPNIHPLAARPSFPSKIRRFLSPPHGRFSFVRDFAQFLSN
jgi:hypothetical protein